MQGFSNIIDNFGSQSKGNFVQSFATRHPPVNNSNPTPKKSSIPLISPSKRQFLTSSQSIQSVHGGQSKGRNAQASSKSLSSLRGRNITSNETNRNLTAASRTSATKSAQQSSHSQTRSSLRSQKTSSSLSKLKSKVNDSYSPRLQPIVENRSRQHSKRTTTDISRLYAVQTPFVVTSNTKNQSQNNSRQEHDRYHAIQPLKKEPKPSLPVPTLKSRVPKSVFSTVIVGNNKFDKSASDVEDNGADTSPSRKTNKAGKQPKKTSKLLPSFTKSRNGRGAASDSDLSRSNKNLAKNSKNALPYNQSYYDAHGVNMPTSLGGKKWASEEKLQKSPYKLHLKANPENNSTSPRGEEDNNTDRPKIPSSKRSPVMSQANELLIKGWSQIYGKPLKNNFLRHRIAEKVKLAQKEQRLRAKIQSKSENRQLEAKKKQKEEDVHLIQDKYDNGLQRRYTNTHMSMKALAIAVIAGMRLKNGWMPDVDQSKKSQPLYATIPIKKPHFDKEGSTTSSRNSIVPPDDEGNKFLPALSLKPNTQQPLNDNNPTKSIFDLRGEQDESILPHLDSPPTLFKSLSGLQLDYELPKTPDFLNRQPLLLDDDDDDDDIINVNDNKKNDDNKSAKSDKAKHVKFSDDEPRVNSGYSNPRTSALSGITT